MRLLNKLRLNTIGTLVVVFADLLGVVVMQVEGSVMEPWGRMFVDLF